MSSNTPGWGTPQQEPQGQGWGNPGQQQGYMPPPPPKQKHTGRNIALGCGGVAALAIVGIIIAVVAAAGHAAKTLSDPKDSNAPLTSSNNGAHPPIKDLTLSNCSVDSELGFASVDVTIKNNTSKPSDYNIQVEFTDKTGKTRLDTGYAVEPNLRPGQTVKSKAQGLTQVKGPITCKVVSADRTASLG